MRLDPLDRLQIESIVSTAVQDAVDFVDSEIAPQRIKAQRYFDLEVDIGHEEGRSSVISSKCRDVVRGLKPSLQRVFLSSEKRVEFSPRGPEDVQVAEQATNFISYQFQQQDGYKLLNDVFQDALVKKTGIAYVYFDNKEETEIETFENLTDDEFALITSEENVEIIEHEMRTQATVDEQEIEVEIVEHDVKISRTLSKGDIAVKAIAPEDFFVDRNSRSVDDCYVIGHSSEMRVSDLLAMGFSLEELADLTNTEYSVVDDEAEFERRGYAIDEGEDENTSAASKKITVTQAFMELDIEGTGAPILYQFGIP